MGRNYGCLRIAVAIGLRDCLIRFRCGGGRAGRRQRTGHRETAVCAICGGSAMTISSNQVSRMLALVPYLRNRGEIPVEDRNLTPVAQVGHQSEHPGDLVRRDRHGAPPTDSTDRSFAMTCSLTSPGATATASEPNEAISEANCHGDA